MKTSTWRDSLPQVADTASVPNQVLSEGHGFQRATVVTLGILGAILGVPASACQISASSSHTVVAIVDGRTLKLDDGSEFRLASLLAPTPLDSPAAETPDGDENAAVAALRQMVRGKSVAIMDEPKARDRYGRRRGHALFRGTKPMATSSIAENWLQARLVRSGNARVMLNPEMDAKCVKTLLEQEALAEAAKRGLWSQALYASKRAEDARRLLGYRGTFQIVEGVVARVSLSRSGAYLNFGRNWKRDFTVRINRSALPQKSLQRHALKRLRRQPVRVRGWVERRNGPLIQVWRLEQIELLTVTQNGEMVRATPPRHLDIARR